MFNKKWDEILKEEVSKEYYIKLRDFIDKEYNDGGSLLNDSDV